MATQAEIEEEKEWAASVFRVARSAMDDCHTYEQAVDLLCDAAALIMSESGVKLDQAVSRLREAHPVFVDAEQMSSRFLQ